jgi:hypothetical protein
MRAEVAGSATPSVVRNRQHGGYSTRHDATQQREIAFYRILLHAWRLALNTSGGF